uniref:hypothetical protein n=1 Tax=Agathobacter sp. TaxID=2021311 RepID=UPI004056DEB2
MFFGSKDVLKPLRRELKLAGADMSAVKSWQKMYEKIKKEKPQIESHYFHVKEDLEELDSVLKELEADLTSGKEQGSFVWRNPMQVLGKKLKSRGMQLEDYENSFVHDLLIGEQDEEFHLTYTTLLRLCTQQIAENDILLLLSEVENLIALTEEALKKECPDFRALAFFDIRRSYKELLELPHFEKLNRISELYEKEFLSPMRSILLEAFKNANEKMPILQENKHLNPEERAEYILEVKIWNL